MGRFLQLLFLILLIRLVWRAVARLLSGQEQRTVRGGATGPSQPIYRGHMVRDPVCGLYIPEKDSLTSQRGGKVYYFCSETCREAFEEKRAAAK